MTSKKTFLTLATTLIASVSLGVGVVVVNGVNNSKDLIITKGDTAPVYTTLDSSNVPSEMHNYYEKLINGTIRTGKNNSYKLQFTRVRTLDGGFCELSGGGKIYNFGSQGHMFNGLQGMQVTFTGQLKLRTAQFGQNGVGAVLTEERVLTSGTPIQFPATTHFQLEAGDDGAQIQSIVLAYSCKDEAKDLDNYNGTYTGYTAEGTKFELVLNNGAASIKAPSLSLELNGTATLSGDRATCVFPFEYAPGQSTDITYVTDIKDYGRKFEFVSKSDTIGGAAANQVAAIDFYRVYNVQDFNNYSGTGIGYDNANQSYFNNTGLRKDYASNYGSGSYMGGNAMGSTDYLTYNATNGIDGTGVGIFKSNTSTCRYFTLNSNFKVAEAIGKGTTFSLWARGAKKSNGDDVTTNTDITIRVYKTIDYSTSGGYVEKTYQVEKGSSWKEFKVALDANQIYYGYAIFVKADGHYLPIDNISIYTELAPKKTYAESSTAVTKSYHGTVTVNVPVQGEKEFTVKVGLAANGTGFGYCGANMNVTGYTINGNDITIRTSGNYSGATYGNWTGTISNDRKTITIPKTGIDGSIGSLVTSTTITLVEDTVGFDGSETKATLQGMLKRQYADWKDNAWDWKDDPGNDNRFQPDTNYFIQGSSSMFVRPYANGPVRFYINPTVAEANNFSFESISFWYFVPQHVNYKINVYSYDAYDPYGGTATRTDLTAQHFNTTGSDEDAGWHYLNLGINTNEKPRQKNFVIYIEKCAVASYIDYLTVF